MDKIQSLKTSSQTPYTIIRIILCNPCQHRLFLFFCHFRCRSLTITTQLRRIPRWAQVDNVPIIESHAQAIGQIILNRHVTVITQKRTEERRIITPRSDQSLTCSNWEILQSITGGITAWQSTDQGRNCNACLLGSSQHCQGGNTASRVGNGSKT